MAQFCRVPPTLHAVVTLSEDRAPLVRISTRPSEVAGALSPTLCVIGGFPANAVIKSQVSYIPLNEPCTEDGCEGRVVVLDALDNYGPRLTAAASFRCRAILLTVHSAPMRKLFGVPVTASALAPATVDTVASVDAPARAPPSLPPTFTPLRVPVICLTPEDGQFVRDALGVPEDLDPTVLLPSLLVGRLKAAGYPEELCVRALQRTEDDIEAALEWLAANAKLFAHQSSMMAELDAAVVESAREQRRQDAAAAAVVADVAAAAAARASARAAEAEAAGTAASETDAPLRLTLTAAAAGAPSLSHNPDSDAEGKGGQHEPQRADIVDMSGVRVLRQDVSWPLAQRWQSAFPAAVLSITDRYSDGAEGGAAVNAPLWLPASEVAAVRSGSEAKLAREWVTIQRTLTASIARRILIRCRCPHSCVIACVSLWRVCLWVIS